MEPVVTTILVYVAAPIAKAGLEQAISSSSKLVGQKLRAKIRKFSNEKSIAKIYQHVKRTRMVKTLWSADKKVDLQQFYFPAKIDFGGDSVAVESLEQFIVFGSKHFVLQGTVGQGKSILLRFLCSKEMTRGSCIPIFLELRNILPPQTIVEAAITEAKTMGLDIDDDDFAELAKVGKIALFLDGFDEIPDRHRLEIIAEIENLCKHFRGCPIVITSRPDSGIESSPLLDVFRLEELEEEDLSACIAAMCPDKGMAKKIVKGLSQSSHDIRATLSTPLMVALLVLHYKMSHDIPKSEVEFYSDLFDTLVRKHDKTKPGYVRERKSGLTDTELRSIFNCLSYLLRRADHGALNRQLLTRHIQQAVDRCGCQSKPDHVLDDLIKVSCLILDDGSECRYIHLSVMEFHSALFLASENEDNLSLFYSSCKNRWGYWFQELKFLGLLDQARHARIFLYDDLSRTISHVNALPKVSDFLTDMACCRAMSIIWRAKGGVFGKHESFEPYRKEAIGRAVVVRVSFSIMVPGSKEKVPAKDRVTPIFSYSAREHVLEFRQSLSELDWSPDSDVWDGLKGVVVSPVASGVRVWVDFRSVSASDNLGQLIESLKDSILESLLRNRDRCDQIRGIAAESMNIFDVER